MKFTPEEIKEGEELIKSLDSVTYQAMDPYGEGEDATYNLRKEAKIKCAIIAQKKEVSVRYEYFSNPEYDDDGLKLNRAKRVLLYLESL